MNRFRNALLLLLLLGAGAALPLGATSTGSTRFIPTFIVYYGGGPQLTAADARKLAKYDLIDIDRFRYNDIGGNTWAAVKARNPAVQIYLYEMGVEAQNFMDGTPPKYLNGLGRYNVSRGHPMGSLNGNNAELFLLDRLGSRVYSARYSSAAANRYWHLMDFGSAAYWSYWLSAVKADIVDQPWVADGIFADNCLTLARAGGYSGTPSKYPTNAAWTAAVNAFVGAISAGLHRYGQKLWCNRGETRFADGAAAWLALDASGNAPDVVLEEGAFAVKWGPTSVQFFQESEWKRQIDTMGAIRNSRVAMISHTKLLEGQSGTDNYGKLADYWQILWYSLGSFLLTKNDLNNHYFMFNGGSGYNRLYWYDEYEKIDLGRAVRPHAVTTVGGVNIYSREFEKGYVYVNPTTNNVSVTLPTSCTSCRRRTHENLYTHSSQLPVVSSIQLNNHHAAIVLKN